MSRVRMAALGCGGTLLLLLLSCGIGVLVQPSSFRIARSRTLPASALAVHDAVVDVSRFERTLSSAHGTTTAALSPEHTGVGAFFVRSGRDHSSRFTLSEITEHRVVYDAVNDDGARTRMIIELASPAPTHTEVTIALEGTIDTLLKRALWPFVGLDRRVGPTSRRTSSPCRAKSSGPGTDSTQSPRA